MADIKQLIESEALKLHALLNDAPHILGLITDPEGKIYFVPASIRNWLQSFRRCDRSARRLIDCGVRSDLVDVGKEFDRFHLEFRLMFKTNSR